MKELIKKPNHDVPFSLVDAMISNWFVFILCYLVRSIRTHITMLVLHVVNCDILHNNFTFQSKGQSNFREESNSIGPVPNGTPIL